jgi:hypothetical protein
LTRCLKLKDRIAVPYHSGKIFWIVYSRRNAIQELIGYGQTDRREIFRSTESKNGVSQ